MKSKRKRKQKNHNNFQIVSVTESHTPQLIVRLTFIKSTPKEFRLDIFEKMPFRLMDRLWERYGVARCFDLNVSKDTPLLTCWYPSNAMRTDNTEVIRKLYDVLFGHLSDDFTQHSGNTIEDATESLMTYFGTIFLRSIATTFDRGRDFQIYMNSVSPIQVSVTDN